MKLQHFSKLLLVALPFVISTAVQAETFKLDPNHSFVGWQISHFGFSSPTGKWYANGTLELDKEKPADSKVNVTIKVANIVTGLPELDKHLKSEQFFDVAKYPTATFVSDKVNVTGADTAAVDGKLTLRGVTKPVTLDVKLNKAEESPITHKMTAGFTASATIKRSDFGMTTYLPGLGDEVKLTIEVEANKS